MSHSPAPSPKSDYTKPLDILSFVVAAQLMMEEPDKKNKANPMISPTSPPPNSAKDETHSSHKNSMQYHPYTRKKRSSTNASDTAAFKCSVPNCDKGFLTVEALNHHLSKHSESRPFICPFEGCQRAFTQLGNLKTHERKHTGVKPFACASCDKSFTQLGNLKAHERLHQGIKSFACKICQKEFSQLGNLKSHLYKVHQFQKASIRDHSRDLSGYEDVIQVLPLQGCSSSALMSNHEHDSCQEST